MSAPSGVRPGLPLEQAKPRNPLSRARIERISDRTVSAFGLVFGLQTLPSALGQLGDLREPWGIVAMVAIFGGLALTVVLAIVQRGVKITMGVLSVVYLAAIVTWPLLAEHPGAFANDKPWVWVLCSVFTAFAAVAYPLWLAVVYTFVAPIAYGVVRALPEGGGAGFELAALDTISISTRTIRQMRLSGCLDLGPSASHGTIRPTRISWFWPIPMATGSRPSPIRTA